MDEEIYRGIHVDDLEVISTMEKVRRERMSNRDKVQGRIEAILEAGDLMLNAPNGLCEFIDEEAIKKSRVDQILSDPDICIKAKDQTPPENPFDKNCGLNESAHNGFEVALLKMRDWVKVEKEVNR